MVRVRRQTIRSNAQPVKKSQQRNQEYLKYKKYLKSKQFKEVKRMCEERDGHMCLVCGRTREDGIHLNCHHRVYKHLYQGGEVEAEDCITLCTICHSAIHSDKKNYTWFSKNNKRNKQDDEHDGDNAD